MCTASWDLKIGERVSNTLSIFQKLFLGVCGLFVCLFVTWTITAANIGLDTLSFSVPDMDLRLRTYAGPPDQLYEPEGRKGQWTDPQSATKNHKARPRQPECRRGLFCGRQLLGLEFLYMDFLFKSTCTCVQMLSNQRISNQRILYIE